MANESFLSVPPNVEDPTVLRRFLSRLVEQVDISYGNRSGKDTSFVEQQQLNEQSEELLEQLAEAKVELESSISIVSDAIADIIQPEVTDTTSTTLINLLTTITPKLNPDDYLKIDDYEITPLGLIFLWSGSVGTIPTNYALCNGSNGTPDLRDSFIVGAGSTYSPGDTGGTLKITENTELTAESQALSLTTVEVQSGLGKTVLSDVTIDSPEHLHALDVDNLPPYYALAYIMKVA